VLTLNPDGIFLSNGPGDPAALDYAHKTGARSDGQKTDLRDLSWSSSSRIRVRRIDVQIEIWPSAARISPVKDLRTGKVAITAQNHGFRGRSGVASPQRLK
jgi:carbamoyl-phosphate synthase small subunit